MATSHCATPARAAMPRPGSVSLAPRATASKTHRRRHPLPVSVVAAASPSTVPAPTTADAWEASFPMSFTASVEDALRADEVVILGTRASLSDPSAIAALPPGFARAFPRALRDLKPGDSGAKRTLMLPRDDADDADDSDLVEVTFGVLPSQTTLSRHNCPAAPQALAGLLSGVSAPAHDRTLGIVAFLAEPDHVIPAAVAAARAFPLYTAKSASGRDTPEGRGEIAIRGEVLFAAKIERLLDIRLEGIERLLDIRLEIIIFLRFRDRSRRSPGGARGGRASRDDGPRRVGSGGGGDGGPSRRVARRGRRRRARDGEDSSHGRARARGFRRFSRGGRGRGEGRSRARAGTPEIHTRGFPVGECSEAQGGARGQGRHVRHRGFADQTQDGHGRHEDGSRRRRGRVGRVRRHRRSPPDAPRRASPGALRGGKRRRPGRVSTG